jgi:hypothetical protein
LAVFILKEKSRGAKKDLEEEGGYVRFFLFDKKVIEGTPKPPKGSLGALNW